LLSTSRTKATQQSQDVVSPDELLLAAPDKACLAHMEDRGGSEKQPHRRRRSMRDDLGPKIESRLIIVTAEMAGSLI
jgi:hypothetical protein